MNKQERIEQCKNDIAKLQESLKELKKEEPIKFGDIVDCKYGKRVALYDSCGKLTIFNNHGHAMVTISGSGSFYKHTGKNVFTNNLLSLDY